ncbi:MAG: SDR family oxidoreductase [Rhodoferax sp.]|nr:SDR family oxidoreductase [Rhodoferax sp.]
MPSNQNPLGALPARFRRQRVLIVGCGDIGMRIVRALRGRVQLMALSSTGDRADALHAQGVRVLRGDLDQPRSLRRIAGLATHVIHLAPPAAQGWADTRTRDLVAALRRRAPPLSLVYGSTSGVYGDCAGALIAETRMTRADTPRARRRVDAEHWIRFFGRGAGVAASILRIPGIYAPDRTGGTPRQRLLAGTPVLRAEDDVYTNHIHADDLARACVAALWRARAQRIYNVNDDTQLKMGDYFDLVADLFDLPRPPRLPRAMAAAQLPLGLLSFMGESRRMDNTRLKRELKLVLRYPTVTQGLQPA